MHPFAADVTATRHPGSPTAAKFSAAHCIAVAILRGTVALADFAQECIADPSTRALREMVELVPDEACSKRSARIKITLRNGTSVEETIDVNRGCPGNPVTDKELEEKLRAISELPATGGAAREIIRMCWQLDSCADVRDYLSKVNE
jgi:2-methylcitrate dehydratase PrpD